MTNVAVIFLLTFNAT